MLSRPEPLAQPKAPIILKAAAPEMATQPNKEGAKSQRRQGKKLEPCLSHFQLLGKS